MTEVQKLVKYCAIALAVFLALSIIGSIVGLLGLITGIASRDGVSDRMTEYSVSAEIGSIEIEASAADLQIVEGDAFSVKSNLKNLTVSDDGGVLSIVEKKRFGMHYDGPILTVTIPSGSYFSRIEITTGAGRFTAAKLSCEDLRLTLGAGEVIIDELNATKNAAIDGGAGAVRIKGGALSNPEINMGVGEFELTVAISGHGEISQGIGSTSVTLLGDRESYQIEFEDNLGDAKIDGKRAEDGKSYGSGANLLEISGGIGKIEVDFK